MGLTQTVCDSRSVQVRPGQRICIDLSRLALSEPQSDDYCTTCAHSGDDVQKIERIALTKLLKQTATDSKYVVDPFTAAERAQIIATARPYEWPTVQFWFETGLRPGELQAFR